MNSEEMENDSKGNSTTAYEKIKDQIGLEEV